MKVSRQTISQQCEIMMSHDGDGGVHISRIAASQVTRPSSRPPLLINPLHSWSSCLRSQFLFQRHLAKIKPSRFDFLCEPFYFPFRVFTVVGSLQKPMVLHLCVVCVCSATPRPAWFSVPAAHSAIWCVCAFLVVMFNLPSCPAAGVWLGLARARALLKAVLSCLNQPFRCH